MRKDVPVEVRSVVSPVASKVADAFAVETSGTTCCYEVDHGFVQLVLEQEVAKYCCRVSHLKAAMNRSDLIEWVSCDDGCTCYLHDSLFNKNCDNVAHMSKSLVPR